MTKNKLRELILQGEGKKKQINVAQADELIGVISDLIHKEFRVGKEEILEFFRENGARRYAEKSKKK